MSKKSNVSFSAITSLYNELNNAGASEDYEKAVKVANKILTLDKTATKAFHYKIVCLIHLEKFQDVLKQLRSCSAKMSSGLQFERAYCEYRENELTAALQTLSACEEGLVHVNQLRGQVLYRLERYWEAFEVFKGVIKNTDDEFNDERQTNLVAVQAQIQFQRQQQQQCGGDSASKPLPPHSPPSSSASYELLYNSACQLVAGDQLSSAVSLLKRAAALCRQQLQEEGADAATVNQEVAIIDTQLAYCRQRQGSETEAASIYHETLRHRPSDTAVSAAIANNIVALNRQRSVFDSRKRMRVLTAADTVARLTGWQKRQLTINQCVFNCLIRQEDQMEKHLADLCAQFPGHEVPAALIRAAHVARSSCQQADQLLSEQLSSQLVLGDGDLAAFRRLQVQLARAQLLLNKGELESASHLLADLDDRDRCRPGVVSARVALCVRAGQFAQAADVIADAVRIRAKNQGNDSSIQDLSWRAGELQMRCGDWTAAAETFEKLMACNKYTGGQQQRLLAQLVVVYCHLDREKAVGLAASLNSDTGLRAGSAVDVAALEMTGWSSSTRGVTKRSGVALGGRSPYSDKKQQSPPSLPPNAATASSSEPRPRRRRKPRLPQNYNLAVAPDPERWLPRRQRTANRPRRRNRRHDVMKGTQGGPAAHSDLYDITKTAPQQKLSPAAEPAASRNAVNRNAQKKRRQGKRAARW